MATAVIRTAELRSRDIAEMYGLMSDYYQNVPRGEFECDLARKDWAVIVRDSRQRILGFTLVAHITAEVQSQVVHAIYAGDTIFESSLRGSGVWARPWGRLVGQMLRESSGQSFYLLLLTSTLRSYRFLGAFFHEYFPRPGIDTPLKATETIRSFVEGRFPQQFDARCCLVRPDLRLQVRAENRGITEARENSVSEFFSQQNPDHFEGDYLACLADLSVDNLTQLGRRFFQIS